ncbi:TRAP transporter small permease [Marinobacter sp. 2_MG-2023]|uniref:TRAP transporter small permease n=1 Tax=Marinobacter sp. 2_MG-2023 TaxID=3062679 RepID=UPI0026E31245|nr:TRAP transporter small permease [Marinobacter sp. 2_MG-2023]MDO6441437.1 TRAP transporter small permease [Marinobacter sp. 2_MG-2023]
MIKIFDFFDSFIKYITFISASLLFIMMLNVGLDVFLRYVSGRPLPLTLELVSYYYMVGITFIPLALVERHDGHIAVDLVVQFFPDLIQRLIKAVMSILGAGLFALMAWMTLKDALSKWDIGEYVMGDYSLPIWPASFALPLGFILFALVLFLKGVLQLSGHKIPVVKESSEKFMMQENA